MNVVHQILKVRIDTSLCINSSLFVGKQMVKLNYSNCNSFELLRSYYCCSQYWILNCLEGDGSNEMTTLSYVPPVIAIH